MKHATTTLSKNSKIDITMTTPSAHERLKIATSPLHRVLDHSPMLRPLLSKELTLPQYTDILTLMRQWYCLNEIFILQSLSAKHTPYSLDPRCKLQFIDHDLRVLNRTIYVDNHTAPMISLDNSYQALGALYVLEGATQGGRFIARKIAQHFGRDDITHFFASYGEQLDERWASFTQHLNQTLMTEDQIEQAIRGASSVFESMITWFDQHNTTEHRAIA